MQPNKDYSNLKVDLADYSVPIWILKNNIKNEKGDFIEFKNHLFLYDYLRDNSKNICGKKCAQVGGSVAENLKTFHLADKRKITTIYTMPSDSDVEEFSKTKTDKIFQANECIRKRLTLDNVGLKQVGNTFLYFKGTRSKAAPISTTADRRVHDEVDRSDLNIIDFYESRIADSEHKMTVLLSNPSAYNVGIDLAWKDSDKKEWFIKCSECGEKQYLTYEDNIDTIRKIFVCKNCNKEFTDDERRKGWWEATGLSGAKWSGYHFSHLMYIRHNAEEIIEAKEKKGIEYFRNFVIGEPYSAGDVPDFAKILLDLWNPKAVDSGQLYLGVDVGKEKHWALGSKDGIFRIGKCEDRRELEEIIIKYNPIAVMDSGPERTWAEEFKRKFPKLWICFYQRDREMSELIKWGGIKNTETEFQKLGYVWIDRNRLIDDLVYNMQAGEFTLNLIREDMEKLIAHWQTMRRMEETNKLGQKRYIWETSTGVNHYASAMWFWWIARKQAYIEAEFLPEQPDADKKLIQVSSDGMKMRDLKEVFDELNQ